MSASGQTRKIEACPLHVRFAPLSGLKSYIVFISQLCNINAVPAIRTEPPSGQSYNLDYR